MIRQVYEKVRVAIRLGSVSCPAGFRLENAFINGYVFDLKQLDAHCNYSRPHQIRQMIQMVINGWISCLRGAMSSTQASPPLIRTDFGSSTNRI